MEKLEFYNKTFSYFYEMIPNDFKKVVFLLDSSRRDSYCPVSVEFFVFFNDIDYIPCYDLPLYSTKYQEKYNEYVKFFKDNYLSISEFSKNNMLTLTFTSDNHVYDEYEMLNCADDYNVKSIWRDGWFNAHLNSSNDTGVDENQNFVSNDSNDLVYEAFAKVYPGQTSCPYYQSNSPYIFGGNDPITGITAYDGKDYWHIVTDGCSTFCDYEFTYFLPKKTSVNGNELSHVLDFLQPIAKSIMNGEKFVFYDYIYDGKSTSVDYEQKSSITGFILVPDPYVSEIDGLKFMCLIGITDDELNMILDKKITVQELYDRIGTCVTDYDRKSVFKEG